MKLRTGFFKADEKGMQYPPEFSNIFKGLSKAEPDMCIDVVYEKEERGKDI